jgi:hypothetical protein
MHNILRGGGKKGIHFWKVCNILIKEFVEGNGK